jgi:hypothetical protein
MSQAFLLVSASFCPALAFSSTASATQLRIVCRNGINTYTHICVYIYVRALAEFVVYTIRMYISHMHTHVHTCHIYVHTHIPHTCIFAVYIYMCSTYACDVWCTYMKYITICTQTLYSMWLPRSYICNTTIGRCVSTTHQTPARYN